MMREWYWRLPAWLGVFCVAGCLAGNAAHKSEPDGAPGATGIAGTVVDQQGVAATGSYVYAYRSAKNGLRGPADFEAAVGEDGRYFLDLVEGEYHLLARQRRGGSDAGPPRPGDAWAIFTGNPVRVAAGQTGRADFRLQGITQPLLLKQGSLTSGETGIGGTVVDVHGRPVPGAFVLAYRDRDFRHMPAHTSAAVGADGRFILYLPEGGTYCLAARTKTRGQPQAGELYGVLGAGDAACRTLRKGEMLEVGAIVVSPYQR